MSKLECDCGRAKHTSLGCGVPMLDPAHAEPDQYVEGLKRALEITVELTQDCGCHIAIRAEIGKREGK